MRKYFTGILFFFLFLFLLPTKTFALESIHFDSAEWLNSHTIRVHYSNNLDAPGPFGMIYVNSDGSFHAGAVGWNSSEESGYVDWDAGEDTNAFYWSSDPGFTRWYKLANNTGASEMFRLAAFDLAHQPPQINPIENTTINEGSAFSYTGSFTDPDSTSWTGSVDFGDGSNPEPLVINQQSKTFSLNHQYLDNNLDNAPYTITVTIQDNQEVVDAVTALVTVRNVAPQAGNITTSVNPVQVNTATTFSATFTDPGNTHDAPYSIAWDWDDGTVEAPYSENEPGVLSKSHTYVSAGVYEVTLTVTDKDGGVVTKLFQYVSVFNPTPQGIFSAGQKYTSPAGAYTANPSATGNVMFGLSYKYQGDLPTGNRQFSMDFNVGNLHFNAETINSLVISNGVGTLTGTGTINDSGTYNFLVVGNEKTNSIRVKIQDQSGNIIYDTQPGAPDTAAPTTAVTAGKILAH